MSESHKSRLVLIALIVIPVLVDVVLFACCRADITGTWLCVYWPGTERKFDWPATIFWFCLIWIVLLICCKVVIYLMAKIPKKARGILQHVWTCALFLGAGIFFVIFPYSSIIRNSVMFWILIALGLFISFMCSASERALSTLFPIHDKSNRDEDQANDNSTFSKRITNDINALSKISDDEAKPKKDRQKAIKKSRKLEHIKEIGEHYSLQHDPALAVATNIGNMLVAVLSAFAIFADLPDHYGARPCVWAVSLPHDSFWGSVIQYLPPLRCRFGQGWLPFPISVQIFQTVLALTLILVIGEILPKQIASVFPEKMCFPGFLRFAGWVGLGTGPSFGAFSALLLKKFKKHT